MEDAICLEMREISKSFFGVEVLKGVNLTVHQGEVLALLGENGAGKSTLMKVLSGVHGYGSYEGDILVNGKEMRAMAPSDAEKAGIAMIYQELNPFLDLTIAENIFMGQFPKGFAGSISQKKLVAQTEEILQSMQMEFDPNTKLRQLNASQQQLVAIARAFTLNASILILDEPTSCLTKTETKNLFDLIERLKKKGTGIIYISHKFDEIYAISDRMVVLRDGKDVGSFETKTAASQDVVKLMIGRDIHEMYPANQAKKGDVCLQVENMTLHSVHSPEKVLIDDISFHVRKGEILGLAGLVGCGRTEILNSIFGSYTGPSRFQLKVDGDEVIIHNPKTAKAHGIALLTEDRRRNGIVSIMSVEHNVTLPALGKVSQAGVLQHKQEEDVANKYVQDLRIKCTSSKMLIKNLSGGNQQKVVLSKWLNTNPHILLLDEPTRGIDVGSKVEIYDIMNRLAQEGIAIVWVSSEMSELMAISDRLLVIYDGKICSEFERGETSQEEIMALATGATVIEKGR